MRAEKMIYFFNDYENFSAEKFLVLLDQKRREKFDKLKKQRDKENCVISYLLLKKALKDFGIENFEIAIGDNGKPFLKDSTDIFFNLSHTDSGVAVVADKNPVGIDVQDILPLRSGVIDRCFSEKERNIISDSSSPDEEFTRLWTLKESAVKCNAETVAFLKNYCFEEKELSFSKYGKAFTTFKIKNLFVSVCGAREFLKITEIKTEDLL